MVFVCGALKHFAQVLSCSISFSRLDSVFLGDVKLIPFSGDVYLNLKSGTAFNAVRRYQIEEFE